jgi:hypothetical protein
MLSLCVLGGFIGRHVAGVVGLKTGLFLDLLIGACVGTKLAIRYAPQMANKLIRWRLS